MVGFHVCQNDVEVEEMSRTSESCVGLFQNHVQDKMTVFWVVAPCNLVDDRGSKHL
jgi:hypothetical protein